MIEILSASALATVQDLGRTGALRWGVGPKLSIQQGVVRTVEWLAENQWVLESRA